MTEDDILVLLDIVL